MWIFKSIQPKLLKSFTAVGQGVILTVKIAQSKQVVQILYNVIQTLFRHNLNTLIAVTVGRTSRKTVVKSARPVHASITQHEWGGRLARRDHALFARGRRDATRAFLTTSTPLMVIGDNSPISTAQLDALSCNYHIITIF